MGACLAACQPKCTQCGHQAHSKRDGCWTGGARVHWCKTHMKYRRNAYKYPDGPAHEGCCEPKCAITRKCDCEADEAVSSPDQPFADSHYWHGLREGTWPTDP